MKKLKSTAVLLMNMKSLLEDDDQTTPTVEDE